MNELFGNRQLLRSETLNRADNALSLLDRHHVAKVHRRQGVVWGLEVSVGDDGWLEVSPGAAYDSCGVIVCNEAVARFRPPTVPRLHALWLSDRCEVSVRPVATGRRSGEVYLATVPVLISRRNLAWGPASPTGRPEVPEPAPPHVAGGRFSGRLFDLDIDPEHRSMSILVPTVNAGFEQTPLYMATIRVTPTAALRTMAAFAPHQRGGAESLGWYHDICRPSPVEFELVLYLDLDLPRRVALASRQLTHPNDLSFSISWIGVDPRRADLDVRSEPCPGLPTYELRSDVEVRDATTDTTNTTGSLR